ncbi:MAG: GNAT family N-acetyltransferase [Meiothermus sp.]|nr:GNAT family N-acetyltransferase [Meiothermus sp.]
MVTLQTPRLLLRLLEPGDAVALMAIFGDPEVMAYSDKGVRDTTWVEGWIRRELEQQRRHSFGRYAVTERDSRALVGYCGLENEELEGRTEIALGYRLARSRWGSGYATEAARAVLEHGLLHLGLSRIVARIDPGNGASVRVAERLGMKLEKEVILEGYTHPDHLYVITR